MTYVSAPFVRMLPAMLLCALNRATDVMASNGPVIGWGSNGYGQARPPDTVNGISGTATEVAAGGWHTCAIQAGTGNVVCWGSNFWGQAGQAGASHVMMDSPVHGWLFAVWVPVVPQMVAVHAS